jgi:two-component system sensor histidine kinase HydH
LLITLGQAIRQVRLQREKGDLARRAQLAEKLAALGTMAAGLAHEIRNPLNAAQLQLGLAERRLASPRAEDLSSTRDCLGLVRLEMERLNRIVQDVLDFAHPAALHAVSGDICATVSTVTRFLAPDAAAAGVTLHVDGTSQSVEVLYDEARIKQVLINLVRNAVEAAGHDGHVWVSVRTRGQMVELKVEDTGPGVPEGDDPFVPFFTTKERGTGLGLPTAHRIVAEHGGILYLARHQERTTFVAHIPTKGP